MTAKEWQTKADSNVETRKTSGSAARRVLRLRLDGIVIPLRMEDSVIVDGHTDMACGRFQVGANSLHFGVTSVPRMNAFHFPIRLLQIAQGQPALYGL